MKILVTSGATREPIDEVRFISNFSTGKTGALIADYFSECGHDLTFFAGQGSQLPRQRQNIVTYEDFKDLEQKLRSCLSENQFDLIIHMAAVSDYSVAQVECAGKIYVGDQLKKIDSSDEIVLRLKRNHKIVERLREYSKISRPTIIAFKLTNTKILTERQQAIEKLSSTKGIDFVVHNDFSEIENDDARSFEIYRDNRTVERCSSRIELARALEKLLRRQNGTHS